MNHPGRAIIHVCDGWEEQGDLAEKQRRFNLISWEKASVLMIYYTPRKSLSAVSRLFVARTIAFQPLITNEVKRRSTARGVERASIKTRKRPRWSRRGGRPPKTVNSPPGAVARNHISGYHRDS